MGGAVDVVYLNFSKASNTVSNNILIEKLLVYGLDKQTVSWVESCLNDQDQRVVISITKSSGRPVTSRVLHWSILAPVLFNIFVSDLNDVTECILSKSADDASLGGALVCQRAMLPSKGTSTGYRNGPTGKL